MKPGRLILYVLSNNFINKQVYNRKNGKWRKIKVNTVYFTDFDLFCSEMIIFETILTTFITNLFFFEEAGARTKIGLALQSNHSWQI
jgi:hypothetical protein